MTQDPHWYKDAVIYQLHVRSFYDSNDDGFGDFEGLRQKLPYLESLGVNALWLLPFFESPLRDDGYDVADYEKILPVHGTVEDFQRFLDEAHERGMRVFTEMVLNHTSDQHRWFQEARIPGSAKRDWYVWSDTADKYRGVRIIFQDFEHSNWTWDPVAKAYYWHRFYRHQPDLNWDNPEVEQALHQVVFQWLDMGVDGVRLDAIPYLYQREGTSCENLPETLAAIRRLRAAVEGRYGPGKALLAEANMWPEDTLPYFGDGDGVQMAFNFPIMPRLYMALRREDRRPILEMLKLTEDIPADAQWVLFLRNHDELTLEMVTDEERDYMYASYATDSQYRINLGIRRRLTPLMGGERKRIELLNALVLSLRGSPVVYYGDELGMGDNTFLGDRNGVRTPMQWNSDRNAGFSRAEHHRLFLPPISEGRYSYRFINAEAQDRDPHSLLNFMRRLLSLRNQYASVFGRGEFVPLDADNRKVLVYLRRFEDTTILIVANLSRFPQQTNIPLGDYSGQQPVELFGLTAFPIIENETYSVMVGPHGFYWFEIRTPVRESRSDLPPPPVSLEIPRIKLAGGLETVLIDTLLEGNAREELEKVLPSFLARQRWYPSDHADSATIIDAVRLVAGERPTYLTLVTVRRGELTELYFLPLALLDPARAEELIQERPQACVAWLRNGTEVLLADATGTRTFWLWLLELWRDEWKGRSLKSTFQAAWLGETTVQHQPKVHLLGVEQSNSAAIVGGVFAKLYRRLTEGPNPEVEILRHLTSSGFGFTPKLQGTLTLHRRYRELALGVAQQALEGGRDAWQEAVEEFHLYLQRVHEVALPDRAAAEPSVVRGWLESVGNEVLELAHALGTRTATMHLALAGATGDLAPEPTTEDDLKALSAAILAELETTRRLARDARLNIAPEVWAALRAQLSTLAKLKGGWSRIRIHGDFHLGQVMRHQDELYMLDFEGEPARSLQERRAKDQAVRDVAGMLRSLEYAGLTALRTHTEDDDEDVLAWMWVLVNTARASFLETYSIVAEGAAFVPPDAAWPAMLFAAELQKVLYEIRYELGHRPEWVWIPVEGLRRLARPLI
jgi:maltose alpha-D-glucosyltransferase / alpha-amylase